MQRSAFFSCLLGLALFGFGCKEPAYNQRPTANWRGIIQDTSPRRTTPSPSPSPTPRPPRSYDNETPTAPEALLMRQALQNLISADTFRADLILPPAEGQNQPIKGELIFNRKQGLRGTIQVGPNLKSEVLMIQDQIYFRANTSTWETITNTQEADRLQGFFRVAFPSELRPNQVLISDSARILETSDDAAAGCKRYVFDEVVPSGEREQSIMCLKGNLPVYIINQYTEGNVEVRYKDMNQPLTIGGF